MVSKPLNKRLLKVFLHDLSAPHSELILHADVCWLSRGEAITSVWKVFEEIKAFVSANDYVTKFPEIFRDDFKINLAFMVDLFQYLTELNKCLQGQKNTICELKEIIFSFQSKLQRFLGTEVKMTWFIFLNWHIHSRVLVIPTRSVLKLSFWQFKIC